MTKMLGIAVIALLAAGCSELDKAIEDKANEVLGREPAETPPVVSPPAPPAPVPEAAEPQPAPAPAPAPIEPPVPAPAVPPAPPSSVSEQPRTAAEKPKQSVPPKPASEPKPEKPLEIAKPTTPPKPAPDKPVQPAKPVETAKSPEPEPAPAPAKPAPKVTLPKLKHIKVSVPARVQELLNADPRMQPWLNTTLTTIEKCYEGVLASNAAAAGTIKFVLEMHENARPDADITSLPPELSGVVACGTGKLMRAGRMPLFTGKEGEKHTIGVKFTP